MAAIIEPHRHRLHVVEPAVTRGSERHGGPTLRLVSVDGRRSDDVAVELGLRTAHLVAAIVGFAVLLLLALAIGNGALAALAPAPGGAVPAAASSATPSDATQRVAVRAGDSLWTIARRLQPSGDVRPLVDQLVALNGSGPLQAGEAVLVPAGT